MNVDIRPLTRRRWADFETLFGARGACGGCWCMWWRLTRATFEAHKGDGNRAAMKALVESGRVPGLLAYDDDRECVGWISVAPRQEFGVLERSRILKPVDDRPVWSVVCFFVRRDMRGKGVSVALLRGAVDWVRERGGTLVEGYPVEPKKRQADAFVFPGLAAAFRRAGFREVARRSPTRPIMRRRLRPRPSQSRSTKAR